MSYPPYLLARCGYKGTNHIKTYSSWTFIVITHIGSPEVNALVLHAGAPSATGEGRILSAADVKPGEIVATTYSYKVTPMVSVLQKKRKKIERWGRKTERESVVDSGQKALD